MRHRSAALWIALGATALLAVVATPGARRWVRHLDAEKAAARDAAATELVRLGPDATEALEHAVAHGSRNTRRRATALLEIIRAEQTGESPAAAREARALVRLALRREQLREGSPIDERLAELGDVAAAALTAAAERASERGLVRSDLVAALGRHADGDALRLLARLTVEDKAAPGDLLLVAWGLRERRDEIPPVEDGEQALRSDLMGVARTAEGPRARAAAALVAAVARPELDDLLTLSRNAAPGVRIEAARALGDRRRDDRGAERLRELALDTDDDVRRAALEALLLVPGRPAPGPALANVSHRRSAIRAAAAELLGREATPDALEALEDLREDRSARVRAATERALRRVGRAL